LSPLTTDAMTNSEARTITRYIEPFSTKISERCCGRLRQGYGVMLCSMTMPPQQRKVPKIFIKFLICKIHFFSRFMYIYKQNNFRIRMYERLILCLQPYSNGR